MTNSRRMEILFWRHSSPAQKRKGTCTINTRVTIYGRRADLGSTGIKTYCDWWDHDHQLISDMDPHSTFKNEQLQEIRTRLLGIYNDFIRRRVTVTADRIKDAYLRDGAPAVYISTFDIFLKEFKEDPSHEHSSYISVKKVRNLFLRFLAEVHKVDAIIEDIDPRMMDRFFLWMRTCKYQESYQVKSARVVKQVVTWAYKTAKLIDFDPLEHYSIAHEKKKKPKRLKEMQLQYWANFEFTNSNCQKAADLFVLYCRTGFHYIDLMQIIKEPEKYIRNGIDNKPWIYKYRQKTEVEAKVPIHKFSHYIDPIIEKYGGWANLPQMNNKDLNDYLKLCVAEINIYLPEELQIFENLCVSHGRKTFSHHILNELAMDKERLKVMLGRKSDTDLDVYVEPDEEGVVNAFAIMERNKKAA